ncbi:hypothetical protein EVAR_77381_1 [Eumeta japonica]|uniref:Uncharacterized protein n=1 Tax=Eumeta variegata TaxID=151549 RepID=A0A4C1UYI7_EUMVA|nr:hypothetical protein EVAR_77381_1 [Eumeta japonica]
MHTMHLHMDKKLGYTRSELVNRVNAPLLQHENSKNICGMAPDQDAIRHKEKLGVCSASPYAAGQHAWVLAARDLPCGGYLMEILSAQEVTGTPARVGPIRYLDAGAV